MDLFPPLFGRRALSSDTETRGVSSPGEGRPRKTRRKNPSRQRQNASEKEKMRMRDLTKALHYLRTFLPPFVAPSGQTLTKIETLRLAISYIAYLSSQLHLQMSSCQNDGPRRPRRDADSDLGNPRKETFRLPRNKNPHDGFHTSRTAGTENGHGERYRTRYSTVQTGFFPAQSEERDGVKTEFLDERRICSSSGSLAKPQTKSLCCPQDYGKAAARDSTDFWT